MGAAVVYSATSNAQTAAYAAADIAELNGVAGATRSWDATTKTLTDGSITAQQVNGIRDASDAAFLVTVQKPVPLAIAKLFVSATSYPIPADSVAELIPANTGQPCILALGTSSSAISVSGTPTLTASGCSVRSDGGVSLSGHASITADSVYAGSNITTSGNATISGSQYPNAGTIGDPYANDTALQNALAQLGSCSSCTTNVSVSSSNTQTISAGNYGNISVSGSATLNMGPGTYTSINVSGSSTVNMSPGLYIVDGPIGVSGSSSVNAPGGVTIIASGSVSMSGSALNTITAPGTSPVGGAIPGIAIAGTTTGSVSMTGTSNLAINGVVYFPNAAMNFSGTWGDPNSPCLELITKVTSAALTVAFPENETSPFTV
jgi:hypothetical protein